MDEQDLPGLSEEFLKEPVQTFNANLVEALGDSCLSTSEFGNLLSSKFLPIHCRTMVH